MLKVNSELNDEICTYIKATGDWNKHKFVHNVAMENIDWNISFLVNPLNELNEF